MEMHLGDHDDEYVFKYDRSRFRSAVVGTLITSILTAILGMIVWPILRDMKTSWVETLHTTAVVLGGALVLMGLIWLYFLTRMIIFFVIHIRGSRVLHRSIIPAWVALLTVAVVVAAVPLSVFGLNLIK